MRRIAITTSVCVMFVADLSLAAGINLQLYGGSRKTTFTSEETSSSGDTAQQIETADATVELSEGFSGMEYGFSALCQPMPLVPVALGVFALQQNFKGDSQDFKETITGVVGGADFMAWIPLGTFEPYARVGYDLFSDHKYALESTAEGFGIQGESGNARFEMDGKVRGYHGAAGVRIKASPFLGAFVQADFADEKFKTERASMLIDGAGVTADVEDAPDVRLKSRSFMIGIDVGT
jgi:hypothetical protein